MRQREKPPAEAGGGANQIYQDHLGRRLRTLRKKLKDEEAT